MKSVNFYLFYFLIFILSFFLFSHKEGYFGYGYDQQWNSPIRDWTPCDTNFYSVEVAPDDNKCCSNISIWNPVESICHPQCSKKRIWNKKIFKCVPPSTRCPEGYSLYRGNGKCGNPGFGQEVDSNF